MIQQTDNRLKTIARYGCYFMSLLHHAERLTGDEMTVREILEIYSKAVDKKYMDYKCYVLKPGKLATMAVGYTGGHNKVLYVGWWNDDMTLEEESAGMWGGTNWEFSIDRYKTNYEYHFMTAGYNPDERIITYGLTGRRFFKVA